MAKTILYIGELGIVVSAMVLSGLTYQTDKLSKAMVNISNEKAALVSKLTTTNQDSHHQLFSALDYQVMQKHLSLAGYWPEGQRLICSDMGGQLVSALYNFSSQDSDHKQLTHVLNELIDEKENRKVTLASLLARNGGLENVTSQTPMTSKIVKQNVYMITCHEGSFSALLQADIQQINQTKNNTFTIYLRMEFERNCLIRAEKLYVDAHQDT
jgi:hypothetical protein